MATVSNFPSTGAPVSFVVPAQCTSIVVECWGAGSPSDTTSGTLTNGGYAKGTLTTTPGETLTITAGGVGGVHNGGFNGGGAGNVIATNTTGGGGASDVRQGGTALANRKIIGAGAGGCGQVSGSRGGKGGAATGEAGAASGSGGGGTPTAGGAAGSPAGSTGGPSAGSSGQGGTGAVDQVGSVRDGGGGGGGGKFGGGGGGTLKGGGGGSNDISGVTSTTSTQGVATPTADGVGYVRLTYNTAPNAPRLDSPLSGSNLDISLAIVAGWFFNDADPGDTQGGFDIQWRVGSGAWTTTNNHSGGAGATSNFFTFTAGTFAGLAGQSIEWQVRTYDALGAIGPWSASSFFGVFNAPSTPTMTGAAIVSESPSPTLNRAGGFVAYQLRSLNDVAGTAGSTVYADTGTRTTVGSVTTVTDSLPVYPYAAATSYHLQGRVQNPSGVWSAWVDSGALVAAATAPLPPTIVVTNNDLTASMTVTITNPGSDPNPAVSNDLYRTDTTNGTPEIRIATGLGVSATYTDWLAGLNIVYRYRAVAFAASGGFTSSA